MEIVDLERRASFSLALLRYEFTEVVHDVHDDNWLVVDGLAIRGEQTWRFREPCLLVEEASSIAGWLSSVADGGAPVNDAANGGGALTFIEPNLGFSVLEYPDSYTVRIRVHLFEAGDTEPRIDLTVTRDALREASQGWTAELDSFPAR